MRKSLVLAVLVAVAVLPAASRAPAETGSPAGQGPAPAVTHGAASAGATHRSIGGDTAANENGKTKPLLTAGDCKALGGKVAVSNACLSRQVCTTTDPANVTHTVCVGDD